MLSRHTFSSLLGLAALATALPPPIPAAAQSNLFNYSYPDPSPRQILDILSSSGNASLDNATIDATQVALYFERSNWAGNSAVLDPFYNDLPDNTTTAPAGSILKVENYTDTNYYTLAPQTALSRFVYVSENVNGSTVPVSAYILWPWLPRSSSRGLQTVVWAHGTIGWSAECAPSHKRNLLYQYIAPYILALQGYVVVATDYAGLGVGAWPNGTTIPHQYQVAAAQGNDVVYSIQAAQAAYPGLLNDFVVMGHSQGGFAAWSAAQILVDNPVSGYLGTVATAPATTALLTLGSALWSAIVVVADSVSSYFPDFSLSDWLTPIAIARTTILQQIQGCQGVRNELFGALSANTTLVPGWDTATWYWNGFVRLSQTGGIPFAGPMLVVQGTNDTTVPIQTVDAAVNATCTNVPDSQLEYVTFAGADHVPTLFASQRVWLDWIADRFAGNNATGGCSRTDYNPFLPVAAYQAQLNYFLEFPYYLYEVAE